MKTERRLILVCQTVVVILRMIFYYKVVSTHNFCIVFYWYICVSIH